MSFVLQGDPWSCWLAFVDIKSNLALCQFSMKSLTVKLQLWGQQNLYLGRNQPDGSPCSLTPPFPVSTAWEFEIQVVSPPLISFPSPSSKCNKVLMMTIVRFPQMTRNCQRYAPLQKSKTTLFLIRSHGNHRKRGEKEMGSLNSEIRNPSFVCECVSAKPRARHQTDLRKWPVRPS